MARALYYPKANRTAQWFAKRYVGSTIDADKVVWHTTETGSWPAYSGGASAPHWTYHADIHQWRQHFPANRSARALRNQAGGVQTNTDDCLQVEIIAYSDERLAANRKHLPVSKLDSQALDDLAEFAVWAAREWGVPFTLAPLWAPAGAGSLRLSFAEWRAFTGHLGHIHVPENTHWDPGRLNIHEVIRRAKHLHAGTGTPPPTTAPPTGEDDDLPTPEEVWTLRGKSGKPYDLLVETHAQVQYLEEQNKSIAGALLLVAKGLLGDGKITDAEYEAIRKAASGQNRKVPPIPNLP